MSANIEGGRENIQRVQELAAMIAGVALQETIRNKGLLVDEDLLADDALSIARAIILKTEGRQ